MQVALVAIDAKYIHTNLAVRYLNAVLHKLPNVESSFLEFTINQKQSAVIQELYACGADVFLFSCYIWNIEFVCAIAKELKKLFPSAIFAVGGPQVSYNADKFLQNSPVFDAAITGEGESALLLFVTALASGENLESCPSLVYRSGDKIIATAAENPINLDILPFAYSEKDLQSGRVLYYETMRGCPFSCSYCLSSIEKGVRFKSFEKVKIELDLFLKADIKQLKFVDRTFNCNKKHAMQIWQYLAQNDNGRTNFHFELAAELLDDEMLAFLQTVRAGLFQFEIGVQSTNLQTLHEIQRPANLDKLFDIVAQLQESKNIHLHLDLIAGLPYEDFESFEKSFDDVYALRPAQFQLGMLKILEGSAMQQNVEKYDILHTDTSPFEVLSTRWISYVQLRELEHMADMVELYYNSGRFGNIVEYMQSFFASPFDFYRALCTHHEEQGFGFAALGKMGAYELLGSLAKKHNISLDERAQWLCRFDLFLHEKAKKMPSWVKVGDVKQYYNEALSFYNNAENIKKYLPEYGGFEPKQILKMAHIEVFPFDILGEGARSTALLFNYERRDIFGKAAVCKINL